MREDAYRYEDIINMPHHVSTKHPQMPVKDRAAQFSPFAALTGYESVIQETARRTDRRIEPDEYTKAELDAKLRILRGKIGSHPQITVTYFVPDERKEGGSYVTVTGNVRKIKEFEHMLVLEEGTEIPIEDIFEIDGIENREEITEQK